MIESVDDISAVLRRTLEVQNERFEAGSPGVSADAIVSTMPIRRRLENLAVHIGLSVDELDLIVQTQKLGIGELIRTNQFDLETAIASVTTSAFELGHILAIEQSKERPAA